MPLDKETANIVREQSIIADFVQGDGWGIIKDRLYRYLDQFNIQNLDIDKKTADEIVADIKVTKRVLELFAMFVSDIEGEAASFGHTQQILSKDKTDYLIIDGQ